MISKVVAANSFYHTCRYICNKPGAEVLVAEGVRGHDYKLMAEDFVMQQEMRPSKNMACFHGILSFYPGEKPSDETMKEIAGKYLGKLGIVDTQYSITKHTDADHLHMHIVANMVNNDGKSINDSFIGLRGKKIAQRLTLEYKLVQALEKNLKLTHLENLSEMEANKYKVYIAISENLPHCRTLTELEARLLKEGIETQYKHKGHTDEIQGISFRIGNFCFKASQVDRKFSYAGLQRSLALQQKQEMTFKQREGKIENKDAKMQIPRPKNDSKNNAEAKEDFTRSAETEETLGEELLENVMAGIGKIVEELLDPIETNNSMPYEFTQKGYMQRQKRKSHKHKR